MTSAVASASTSALRPTAISLRNATSSLAPQRYAEHYHRVLAQDLLYLTYDHTVPPARLIPPHLRKADQLAWDPENPYTKNRPAKKPRGGGSLIPATRMVAADNVVRLEEIVINTFVKEAAVNKSQVLSAIAGLQAMTGQPLPGFAAESTSGSAKSGIQVLHTKKASASFKVRAGQVCGAKVSLKGEAMWSFLETLVELVLPRLKDWNGVKIPPPSTNLKSPAQVSGVVSFGLPPAAMGLFPGTELNVEQFPRLHGFNLSFITNVRGLGAQDQARALMSGFRIPL